VATAKSRETALAKALKVDEDRHARSWRTPISSQGPSVGH
jgi:hypothetical protein